MALEEAYQAEQKAEMQRSERERATRIANIVVPTQIEKEKIQIEADAVARGTAGRPRARPTPFTSSSKPRRAAPGRSSSSRPRASPPSSRRRGITPRWPPCS